MKKLDTSQESWGSFETFTMDNLIKSTFLTMETCLLEIKHEGEKWLQSSNEDYGQMMTKKNDLKTQEYLCLFLVE